MNDNNNNDNDSDTNMNHASVKVCDGPGRLDVLLELWY